MFHFHPFVKSRRINFQFVSFLLFEALLVLRKLHINKVKRTLWCRYEVNRNLFNMVKTSEVEFWSDLRLKYFYRIFKHQIINSSDHVLKCFLTRHMRGVTFTRNRIFIFFFVYGPQIESFQLNLRIKTGRDKLNLSGDVKYLSWRCFRVKKSFNHFVKFSHAFFFQTFRRGKFISRVLKSGKCAGQSQLPLFEFNSLSAFYFHQFIKFVFGTLLWGSDFDIF